MDSVTFHLEGNSVVVSAPSLRTFTRADSTTYNLLGWWVDIKKPAGTEGLANLYVEATPADTGMQSRVIGPHPFLLYDDEFDATLSVGSGETYADLSAAWNAIRTNSYDRPLVEITDGAISDPGAAIGQSLPEGFITIRATTPVTLKQAAPALAFDFTRINTRMGRMKFTGSNITIDFVETLQMDTEAGEANQHWFDGVKIRQSRGRDDLWRKGPRNIIPSLVDDGAYFTDCDIQDVNDWGDKTPLARGNITNNTWADALQDAKCAVANEIEDHSSAPYYTNVDALTVQYTGSAATATISYSGSNMGNNRVLTLKEDGVSVATFTVLNTEQAFRDDTNYTVQNVVDFINGQSDWTATLVDDTRYAAAISEPGTTTGASFTDLDAKTSAITLPTHFDIHSDIYQLANAGAVEDNVVFAFNRCWQIDAQNTLITGTRGIQDAMFICNAIYNNLGTPDEGLQSQFSSAHSHVVYAHNSLATQNITLRTDLTYSADIYCVIGNNVALDMSDAGGGAAANVTIDSNHIHSGETVFPGATNTTIGGDETTLFVDAINGDFTPAGDLLTNTAAPILPRDLTGAIFPNPTEKGAIA